MIDSTSSPFAAPPAPSLVQRQGKPLQTLRGTASLVGKGQHATQALIEDGKILYAFNVAFDLNKRPSLRILPAAIADYLQGRECALTLPEALCQIFPQDSARLSTVQISAALNICDEHALHLLKSGALGPCSNCRPGPGGAATVPRGTAEAWLEKRRWPHE